jgi:hypothetical protein
MKKIIRIITEILILILICKTADAQCNCLGGAAVGGLTPIGGTANMGVMRDNYLRLSLFYNYAYGDNFFRRDSYAEKDLADYYITHYSSLTAAYGINNEFTIETEIGYFPLKLQEYDVIKLESHGLSHLSLTGKYNVFNSIVNETELTLGAGLKLPLSLKTESVPQHVRASTGAYGFTLFAFLHKGFKDHGTHLFLINRSDYNFENRNKYQYGQTYNTSFFITQGISEALTALLEIRNEIRSQDYIDGNLNIDSGGWFFHFSPQINFTYKSLNLALYFDYPFYQYYYGYQLGNNYSTGLNFTWQTKL